MRVKSGHGHEQLLLSIGNRLKQMRTDKGYTSHERFAHDFDLPRVQYWRMEKGIANITFRSLSKVLIVHNMTIQEFLLAVLKKPGTK